jgi:hypothetical protein
VAQRVLAALIAIPALPLIALAIATAAGTFATTGRLMRWLPETPASKALTAAMAIATPVPGHRSHRPRRSIGTSGHRVAAVCPAHRCGRDREHAANRRIHRVNPVHTRQEVRRFGEVATHVARQAAATGSKVDLAGSTGTDSSRRLNYFDRVGLTFTRLEEFVMASIIRAGRRREIEAANASGNTPVVFIHGLWLLPSSWANWADFFKQAGLRAADAGLARRSGDG